jgi:cytoskeletal protein CcmA (bactofilin family)
MGFFSSGPAKPGPAHAAAASAPNPRRRSTDGAAGLSIVAKDLTIAGDLQAAGIIRVEGRIIGCVHSGDQVLVSEGGVIEGDVVAREAVIAGRVHGSIQAEERVELQASAVVHGDILTRRLLIQEGGAVNGGVRMEGVNQDGAKGQPSTVNGKDHSGGSQGAGTSHGNPAERERLTIAG